MKPVLFTLSFGGETITVLSYVFFMTAAAVFSLTATAIAIRYYKLPFKKYMLSIILLVVSALIGARLLYTILYLPESIEPVGKIFTPGFSNFSLHGGLGGGLAAAWIVFRKNKESFLMLLDILSPVAGISAAIARVGCFLNGCCFGKVTNMPWGIKYPLFSSVHIVQYNSGMILPIQGPLPVHPTQLYEIFAAIISSAAAFALLKRKKTPGYTAAVFGLVYTLGRFIIFFFRDFKSATPLSNFIRGPVTYGIAIIVFSVMLIRNKEKS